MKGSKWNQPRYNKAGIPFVELMSLCINKAKYSEREAQRRASYKSKEQRLKFNAYYCARCDCWHIGHERKLYDDPFNDYNS